MCSARGGAVSAPEEDHAHDDGEDHEAALERAGQIGCEIPGHAPYRWSDTWVWERWRPVTLNERIALAADLGQAPECEVCAARARREREAP